jgi:hypothetical protein
MISSTYLHLKMAPKKKMVPFLQGSLIAFDMVYSFHFHYVNNLYNKREGWGTGEDQEKDCKHELTKKLCVEFVLMKYAVGQIWCVDLVDWKQYVCPKQIII